jgi:hypothetical protein
LVKVKAYKPPTNVEDIIKEICQKTLGQQFHEKNFKTFNFTDPLFKFQVYIFLNSNPFLFMLYLISTITHLRYLLIAFQILNTIFQAPN